MRILFRILIAVFLVAILGIGGLFAWYESGKVVVGDLAAAQPAETRTAPATDAQLAVRASRILQDLRIKGGYPAVSAAVIVNGQLAWQEARGWARIETRSPASIKSAFAIGSVSKVLTASVAMKLAEQGVLDLDRDIRAYLPAFPAKAHPVTARQLLSHQAGIRHYRFELSPPTFSEMGSTVQYDTTVSSLAPFAADPLLFKPDTDFSYSSYGFTLLSAVMEAASRTPFLQLMERELFAAQGLSHTGADDLRTANADRAADYQNILRDGAVVPAPVVNVSGKWAGGGFRSSPTDLATFGSALISGKIIGQPMLQVMFEPRKLADGKVNRQNYALGVRVDTITDDAYPGRSWRAVHHGGVAVGAQSMLVMLPDQGVVVAISTNASTQPPAQGLFGAATSIAVMFAEGK